MNKLTELQAFWGGVAIEYLDWLTPWDSVYSGEFAEGSGKWFNGGQLNVCVNCVDRHLVDKANQLAIIWQGDGDEERKTLTFKALHEDICRMANVLKQLGVKRGDKVALYLPMIPEALVTMLACTRIGAVHTVVFAGFSAKALRQRIKASEAVLLITADGIKRGGKLFPIKEEADEATLGLPIKTLIIKHQNTPIMFDPAYNYWWHELRETVSTECLAEVMNAEDPLFILYTSGSTGQPKGLVHTTGGYLVQVAYSYKHIFNCSPGDIYWCTADIGWVTGHSYLIYGPLCNGVTTLLFSGIPTWPSAARCWKIIDDYKVNVFYTAPTAIRALKRAGDEWLNNSSRESLRLLGTVGEPINPKVWRWYFEQVGRSQAPIVDTWWQTETGAAMICPNSHRLSNKPGSATKPMPGIYPVLLNEEGKEIEGTGNGALAIKYPWPALARTILGDHARYCQTYFKKGYYITGDGAKRDEDGDYWISGRIDDVLNVSGHRLGTAEIESALLTHRSVAEAAVVGMPHELKGQAICAFVSLKAGVKSDETLNRSLVNAVVNMISPIAKPELIRIVDDLPKTRSGKIMRRILRLIAAGEAKSLLELGDLSTLANPECVERLLSDQ